MHKRIIVSIIAAAALAIGALPAGASNSTPTGARLGSLFVGGGRAILAGAPFYVTQSFVVDDPTAGYCGGAGQPTCDTATDVQQSSISLTIDGKVQNGSIIQTRTDTKPSTLISKTYLFNFPNGLPVGTYVLSLSFTIRGQNVGTFNTTLDALASCQYGVKSSGPPNDGIGLYCLGPPA
jgi:hypothetical protein